MKFGRRCLNGTETGLRALRAHVLVRLEPGAFLKRCTLTPRCQISRSEDKRRTFMVTSPDSLLTLLGPSAPGVKHLSFVSAVIARPSLCSVGVGAPEV